jgi:hypothetical protein
MQLFAVLIFAVTVSAARSAAARFFAHNRPALPEQSGSSARVCTHANAALEHASRALNLPPTTFALALLTTF